ncbi:MAG: hypothetical protein AAGA11_10125 [Pseudomonadota bacterium]
MHISFSRRRVPSDIHIHEIPARESGANSTSRSGRSSEGQQDIGLATYPCPPTGYGAPNRNRERDAACVGATHSDRKQQRRLTLHCLVDL